MTGQKCTCGNKSNRACPACMQAGGADYWCDVCDMAVSAKRCPTCGLKTRKVRK